MTIIVGTSVLIRGDIITVRIDRTISIVVVPGFSAMRVGPDHENWHYYDPTEVCAPAGRYGVTRDAIWRNLIEEPFPSFMNNATPVQERTRVVPFGMVRHVIEKSAGLILNVTEPDHWLHPGLVIRALSERAGNWVITTIGCGNGRLGAVNAWLSSFVWSENVRRIGRETIYEAARATRRPARAGDLP